MSTTRNLLVSVPFVCSRTDKEHAVKVPVEEAQAFLAQMAAKEEAAAAVLAGINAMPVKPDVVIYYKGQCVVLANVHDKSDAAISRAFNEIANKDIFLLREPKSRKKGDKVEKTDEPEIEAE